MVPLPLNQSPTNNLSLKGCFTRISYIGGVGGGEIGTCDNLLPGGTPPICVVCYPTILSFLGPLNMFNILLPTKCRYILICSFLSFPLINGFRTEPHFSILPVCYIFLSFSFLKHHQNRQFGWGCFQPVMTAGNPLSLSFPFVPS